MAVALALAGCGGGKKASTPILRPEAPAVSYTVHLAGASGLPRPASRATGLAVISLYPSSEALCWMFSQLDHVTTPKRIVIAGRVRGAGFFSAPLGPYRAAGCRQSTPKLFFHFIEGHPHNFEVIISTKQVKITTTLPGGPLRGKL